MSENCRAERFDCIMSNPLLVDSVDRLGDAPEWRPDLGVQYSAGSRYPAALEPEIRLMIMILEDAILCYKRYLRAKDPAGRKEFHDAQRWIFGRAEDWIFSFDNICACIGVDPHYLRHGLRQWKQSARGLPSPESV
jgi:hypothetical protein